MTPNQAIAFVNAHGVVLESARGPVPSLAATIAGGPIRGSWWKHPKAQEIFRLSRAVRDSEDVLVCRLVGGKVTFVHRRLWPALVRLAERFDKNRLAAIRETHTASGKHAMEVTPYPVWVPVNVRRTANTLTERDAGGQLSMIVRGGRGG